MKAIVVRQFGDESVLEYLDWDQPRPGPDELLVNVRACAVNPVDTLMRAGKHPRATGTPLILGIDIAGVVAQVGNKVTGFQSGDRVFGFSGAGGYAQYTTIKAEHCASFADNVDFEMAAASASSPMTALYAIRDVGGVAPGEALWIRGGAGGVGTAAIQIGKVLGARVLADCGNDGAISVLRELGADEVFNRKTTDPVTAARRFSDRGIDCVLDLAGTENVMTDFDALRPGGRVLIVGLGTGKEQPRSDINLRAGLITSATVHFVYLFNAVEHFAEYLQQIAAWMAKGTCRPLIAATFPLHEAASAHRRLLAGGILGKLVLAVPAS